MEIKNAICACVCVWVCCKIENRAWKGASQENGVGGMGEGGGVRQDTKDSGNIFANKRKLNLRPRMASFVRPSSTKSPKSRKTNWKESFYKFACAFFSSFFFFVFVCVIIEEIRRQVPAPLRLLFRFQPTHVISPIFHPFFPCSASWNALFPFPLFCLRLSQQLSCCHHTTPPHSTARENAILTGPTL